MKISVQFSRSVMSNSLRPHEPQHAGPPCSSPTPGVYPNLCSLSQWCPPTISSYVVPFSSCLQSFLASASFPMSQLSFKPIFSLPSFTFIKRLFSYWIAIFYSRGSAQPRNWSSASWSSCIGRWILYHWATSEPLLFSYMVFQKILKSNCSH